MWREQQPCLIILACVKKPLIQGMATKRSDRDNNTYIAQAIRPARISAPQILYGGQFGGISPEHCLAKSGLRTWVGPGAVDRASAQGNIDQWPGSMLVWVT